MKNMVFVLVGLVLGQASFGAERVLLADSKTITTEVSNATVRCSAFGYGMSELKINLHGLDGWTLFDHSNLRVGDVSGEPCMTAGACRDFGSDSGFSIDDLVKGKPGLETITVDRRVIEVKQVLKQAPELGGDICVRSLREELHTVIRGVVFNHQRAGESQNFPLKACQHLD